MWLFGLRHTWLTRPQGHYQLTLKMARDKGEIVSEDDLTEKFYEGEIVEVRVPAKTVTIVLNTNEEGMTKFTFAVKKKVKMKLEG